MANTNTDSTEEPTRRDFLYIATMAMGAVGAGAIIWPFVSQMSPDASTLALASIDVDLSSVQDGQSITVMWRGKPVFIRKRTTQEIEESRNVDLATLPDPQEDFERTKEDKPEWLVMVGICTHLGCVPLGDAGDYGGWFCPCHGSHYDNAGRIRKGPAPTNLEIPPYEFVTDTSIRIG